MRNIKKIILIFVLSFLFITTIKAENFTCKIGGYNVKYDTLGKIVEVEGFQNKILSSDFSPKNVSECPSNDEGEIKLTDGGISLEIVSLSAAEKKEDKGGCSGYRYESSCEHNKFYSCVWNDKNPYGDSYCNTDKLIYVQCGDAFDIPYQAPQVISFFVNLLKIATPIILIIVSIIALLKAISASNEDEIKKSQKGLIRKVIAAVMVFFVISIVQFVVMKVADNTEKSKLNAKTEDVNLSTCLSCFLNNDCENNAYYKTSVFGKYECTYFKDINNPNADKTCPQDKIKLTK